MHSTSETFLLTIGIPAYNAERYLEECLNSLECQLLPCHEVIIVNDGSTDNTAIICDAFSRAHNNVNVINKRNQGVQLARKDIITHAQGEYIIFLDADDCLNSKALKDCQRIISEYRPDMVLFDYSILPDFSSPIRISNLHTSVYCESNILEIKKSLCLGKLNSVWGKAIKRENLVDSLDDLPNLIFSEDFYQMILVFQQAHTLYYLQKPLYFYRQNEQSNTSNYQPRYLEDLETTLMLLLQLGNDWKLQSYAEKGALLQLCYLASILVSDRRINILNKTIEIAHIRQTIRKLKIQEDAIDRLRIDLRFILRSIVNGRGLLAICILKVHLFLRKILHRL